MPATIFTIGHSTHSTADFIALLKQAGVGLLVDIRSIPRSRHNPQFNQDVLPAALAAAGIGYRHLKSLGGRRQRPKDAPPSQNGLWENDAFRNFADYAGTEAFRGGLAELCELAAERPTAIMCAESLWWRCHRRIVADHLLARGVPVAHILGSSPAEPAVLTPGAVLGADGSLTYPSPAPELDLGT